MYIHIFFYITDSVKPLPHQITHTQTEKIWKIYRNQIKNIGKSFHIFNEDDYE